jgi:MYXO-CTERM domain-containing protein
MRLAQGNATMTANAPRSLLVVAALLLAGPAQAAPADRAAARQALAALEARGPVQVLWPAGADTPRHVSGPLAAARTGRPDAAARAFLQQHQALFALRDAAREVRLHAAVPTTAGTAVRFLQEHAGLPVHGAHVVVMVDPAGRVFLANSSLRTARPALPAALVAASVAQGAVAARGALAGAARLVWLPVGRDLRAVWVVWGRTVRPFGVWDYYVDATDGSLVGRRSRLLAAKGRVYQNSPVAGSAGLIDVDLAHLTSAATLTGDHTDTWRATIGDWYNIVTRDRKAVPANGDYLFNPQEPSFTDPFAEVQLYHHVTSFHQWLLDQFQFQRTTRGTEQFITSFANVAFEDGGGGFGQFDNAFAGDIDGDGKTDLALGQGSIDFGYDAEVIYHEFTHSAIEEGPRLDGVDIDALGLNMDPMSLNEALADYFACAYTNDPVLGEYAGEMGGGIRQLTDPSGEHMQCRDVPLQGESHDDGMPLSRGLWDVRAALGAAKADAAIWAAVQALAADASFADLSTSLVAIVQQKHGATDAATAKARLDARDLTECPRLFPVAHGAQHMGYVWGQQSIGNIQIPHALQYAIDVPVNATRLTLGLSGYGVYGGSVKLIPYVRRVDPVLVDMSGYDLTYQADVTGQANRDLVLTPDSATAKLVPGQMHYLLVTNDGEDDMVFDLSVSVSTTPLVQTDAGVPDAKPATDGPKPTDGGTGDGATGAGGDDGDGDGPKRGCACRAGGAAAATPALLLALLGLALVAARRRRA